MKDCNLAIIDLATNCLDSVSSRAGLISLQIRRKNPELSAGKAKVTAIHSLLSKAKPRFPDDDLHDETLFFRCTRGRAVARGR